MLSDKYLQRFRSRECYLFYERIKKEALEGSLFQKKFRDLYTVFENSCGVIINLKDVDKKSIQYQIFEIEGNYPKEILPTDSFLENFQIKPKVGISKGKKLLHDILMGTSDSCSLKSSSYSFEKPIRTKNPCITFCNICKGKDKLIYMQRELIKEKEKSTKLLLSNNKLLYSLFKTRKYNSEETKGHDLDICISNKSCTEEVEVDKSHNLQLLESSRLSESEYSVDKHYTDSIMSSVKETYWTPQESFEIRKLLKNLRKPKLSNEGFNPLVDASKIPEIKPRKKET